MNDPIFQKFDQVLGTKTPPVGAPAQSRADEIRALAKQSQQTQQPTQPEEPQKQNWLAETTGLAGFGRGIAGAAEVAMQPTFEKRVVGAGQQSEQLIQQAHALPMGDTKRTQLLQQANQITGRAGKVAEGSLKGLQQAPSALQMAGSTAKLGLTVGTPGIGVPGSIAGRLGAGAAIGAGFGAAQGAEENKSLGGIGKSAAIGGALGLATAGTLEGAKWAINKVPKLLSYTSDVPEEVLKRNYDNPKLMAKATKDIKTLGVEGVKKQTQAAARELRTNLSQQYEEGAKAVVSSNAGKTIQFTPEEKILINQVKAEHGIKLPTDLNNVGAKEALDLNKEINALYKKFAVREGAKGFFVRDAKEAISNKLGEFAGAKEMLSNYSVEKEVLDAASAILKPYNKSPITQATVNGRLMNAFNENKAAYISALKDLGDKTGKDLVSNVAALKTKNIGPTGGGLVKSLLKAITEPVTLPLTSPRGAAALSRVAGRAGQLFEPKAGALSKGLEGSGVLENL